MRVYQPTPEERETTLVRGDFLKLSGDGVFATRQGEGVTAGKEAVFVRLQNCNLHCGANGKGWACDAWYTWDRTKPEYWQETTNVPTGELAEQVIRSWDTAFGDVDAEERLVITGGEPLLQQRKLPGLLSRLSEWVVEIETNGTISPHEFLNDAQINCSPKLASSGNSVRARYRPEVLRRINALQNAWFKFVIADFDTDPVEVVSIMDSVSIDPRRVLLMCEGTDARRLTESEERVGYLAQKIGCGVTRRNHIFWYGDKRAT